MTRCYKSTFKAKPADWTSAHLLSSCTLSICLSPTRPASVGHAQTTPVLTAFPTSISFTQATQPTEDVSPPAPHSPNLHPPLPGHRLSLPRRLPILQVLQPLSEMSQVPCKALLCMFPPGAGPCGAPLIHGSPGWRGGVPGHKVYTQDHREVTAPQGMHLCPKFKDRHKNVYWKGKRKSEKHRWEKRGLGLPPPPFTVPPKLFSKNNLYLDQAGLELVAILILGLQYTKPHLPTVSLWTRILNQGEKLTGDTPSR